MEENVKAYRLPAESELESLSQRAVAPMQRSGVLTNRNSFNLSIKVICNSPQGYTVSNI